MTLLFSLNINSKTNKKWLNSFAFDIFVRIESIYANVKMYYKKARFESNSFELKRSNVAKPHTHTACHIPKANFHIITIWNSWEIKIKFHSKLLSIFRVFARQTTATYTLWHTLFDCLMIDLATYLPCAWAPICISTWNTFFYAVGA